MSCLCHPIAWRHAKYIKGGVKHRISLSMEKLQPCGWQLIGPCLKLGLLLLSLFVCIWRPLHHDVPLGCVGFGLGVHIAQHLTCSARETYLKLMGSNWGDLAQKRKKTACTSDGSAGDPFLPSSSPLYPPFPPSLLLKSSACFNPL